MFSSFLEDVNTNTIDFSDPAVACKLQFMPSMSCLEQKTDTLTFCVVVVLHIEGLRLGLPAVTYHYNEIKYKA